MMGRTTTLLVACTMMRVPIGWSQHAEVLESTSGFGIAELQNLYERSEAPQPSVLPGTWVMIRHVTTERFVNGQDGPDRVSFNSGGLHYGGDPESPLEWVLTLEGPTSETSPGTRSVTAVGHDIVSVEFDAEGELVIGKDYAGDSIWLYRCRLLGSERLVCLMRDHQGHGVECAKRDD